MDTLLNDEEREVKDAVRAVLAAESTPELARELELTPTGYSPQLWKQLGDLGWVGLCLPEEFGGSGRPIVYGGLIAEEVGRHVSPVPFATTLAAAYVVDLHGDEPQRREILRGVAERNDILSYAVAERGSLFDLGATRLTGRIVGEEIVLDGTKRYVENFNIATTCLVSCRVPDDATGEPRFTLLAVDTKSDGISITPLTPTAKDNQAHVHFDGVRVPMANAIGGIGGGPAPIALLIDCGAVLLASQMSGAARRSMEYAVKHAKERVAFEQPIGAFQAIQHMSADMLIWVDGAELLSREALWMIGEHRSPRLEASQAKAFANDRLVAVCRSSQQIHGGMGFMMEFDLHLWYRRVASWSMRTGNSADHRARVAAGLLDQAGDVRLDAVPPPLPLKVG